MKECDRLRPVLVRMVEGDAGPDEALEIGRHLSDCTVCRIALARQRRIAEMVSGMGEPIEVDESFLRRVMDSLPEGPPPRAESARRSARVLRGLKLASFLLLGCLLLPGAGDATSVLGGAGDLPAIVSAAQPETLGELPAALEGVSGVLVSVLARAELGTALDLPVHPAAAAGILAALLAGATTMLLALSAGVGMAARLVARNLN